MEYRINQPVSFHAIGRIWSARIHAIHANGELTVRTKIGQGDPFLLVVGKEQDFKPLADHQWRELPDPLPNK
jgi:hypothetical protein